MDNFLNKARINNIKSRVITHDSGYLSVESVHNQIVCLMRLMLAVSALIITFIAPTSPTRLIEIAYAILIGYCFYSAILYLLSFRSDWFSFDITPWIDLVWYVALITLSNSATSVFFFFFPIIVAAFRSGFKAGLHITVISALLFSAISYATAPPGEAFELNRFLIRPFYLMMFGYIISYWGGQVIKSKRHQALIKDVNRLSNPRFGVNRTLSHTLNRIRSFYDAESCVLITFDSSTETYKWRESSRGMPNDDLKVEQTAAAAPLVKLPGELAVLYQSNAKFWRWSSNKYACDVSTGNEAEIEIESCIAIADLLEAESYLTVPVFQHGDMIARLYLTARENCFKRSDIELVSQLIEQVLTAVENIELLSGFASNAADRQRQKISRDLHDSTIQPYIVLKLGLEALEIKYAAGKPIAKDVQRLIKLTDSTVAELRGFVSSLKGETSEIQSNALIQAIKQQVAKFQEFYDIEMSVQVADGFSVNDLLAAEAFQIVSEGLSNIKRHTKAKQGEICIYKDVEKLFLEIKNDHDKPGVISEFVPKSIAGRAASLGGTSRVERLARHTKVVVEIPL